MNDQSIFRFQLLPVLALAILSVGIVSCAGDSSTAGREVLQKYAENFVPTDASNKISEEEIPWIQISFDVNRGPLEFIVDDGRLERAKKDGWLLCQPNNNEWLEYPDATVEPMRMIRQRAFMLYKQGTLITLLAQHVREVDSPERAPSSPELKQTVHGTVSARNSSDRDAREAANSFDLTCT